MVKYLRLLIFIAITLVIEAESSRWREILVEKLPTFKGFRLSSKIAGGEEAEIRSLPFTAMFFNILKNENTTICSGSIISANYVLTAAHCFYNLNYSELIAGVHNWEQDEPEYENEDVTLEDIDIHPKYDTNTLANDIAIVSTRRHPFTFTRAIQPIPLAPRSFSVSDLTGMIVRVAGWGLTSDAPNSRPSTVLRFIDVPIISQQKCRNTYGPVILDSMFCLDASNNKSTCSGDSGGGATIIQNNVRVLLGIVSFGSDRGCQKGIPTVKTRVPSYIDWISLKTGISNLQEDSWSFDTMAEISKKVTENFVTAIVNFFSSFSSKDEEPVTESKISPFNNDQIVFPK